MLKYSFKSKGRDTQAAYFKSNFESTYAENKFYHKLSLLASFLSPKP